MTTNIDTLLSRAAVALIPEATRWTIANGLNAAADKWDAPQGAPDGYAQTVALPSIADQFRRQAAEVRALAARLTGADVPANPDAPAFEGAGFTIWETGGGCTAWRRDIPGGPKYILVTGLDGCCHELANESDRYLVGLHIDAEADSWPASDYANAAEAIEAADRMGAANV